MEPVLGWKVTTVGRGSIHRVSTFRPYQVVKVHQEISIWILITDGAIRDMRHTTARGRAFRIQTPRLTVCPTLRSARGMRLVTLAPSRNTKDWQGQGSSLWMQRLPHQDKDCTETCQEAEDEEGQRWQTNTKESTVFCQKQKDAARGSEGFCQEDCQKQTNHINMFWHSRRCKISLFKNKNHKVSVSVDLYSSCMRSIIYLLGTGTPNLIPVDVLNRSWLDSIHQRDISDIRNASDITWHVSGDMIPHLRTGESRTRDYFGFLSRVVVPVLLETTHIDRYIIFAGLM